MTKSKLVEDGAQSDAALDPKALEAIGKALKSHYDDLVQAPLPDKFIELLDRLEVEEQQRLGARGKTDAFE
jgi:hypothetical protein